MVWYLPACPSTVPTRTASRLPSRRRRAEPLPGASDPAPVAPCARSSNSVRDRRPLRFPFPHMRAPGAGRVPDRHDEGIVTGRVRRAPDDVRTVLGARYRWMRDTAVPPSTTPPSTRRHGLTPRINSSRAQITRAPVATSPRIRLAWVWLWSTQEATMATPKTTRGTLGICAMVMRSVDRLVNHHSKEPGRSLYPSGRLISLTPFPCWPVPVVAGDTTPMVAHPGPERQTGRAARRLVSPGRAQWSGGLHRW